VAESDLLYSLVMKAKTPPAPSPKTFRETKTPLLIGAPTFIVVMVVTIFLAAFHHLGWLRHWPVLLLTLYFAAVASAVTAAFLGNTTQSKVGERVFLGLLAAGIVGYALLFALFANSLTF